MSATVAVRIAGSVVDSCEIALPLEISHGRSGNDAQPDAPTCSFTWEGGTFPWPLGTLVEVGTAATVEWSAGAGGATWADMWAAWADMGVGWAGYPTAGLRAAGDPLWADPGVSWDGAPLVGFGAGQHRFVGVIADVAATEQLGQVVSWKVTAIGGLANLGRLPVLASRPAEVDTARVAAIATAAGITTAIQGGPGLTLAANTIDRDTLAALHEVCESSGGLVWQTRDGLFVYGTADHREVASTVGVLPDCAIIDGIEWTSAAESVVNHVTVEWGPEDARAQVTHSDSASITAHGLRHVTVSTQCATEPDADQLGLLILARRKDPYWVMPGVLVHMDELTGDEVTWVNTLDVSSAVLAAIPNAPGSTPGALAGWTVEGWVERWDETGHWLQLALSDRARWVQTTFRTWGVAATYNWAEEAAGSWLDALIEEAA